MAKKKNKTLVPQNTESAENLEEQSCWVATKLLDPHDSKPNYCSIVMSLLSFPIPLIMRIGIAKIGYASIITLIILE